MLGVVCFVSAQARPAGCRLQRSVQARRPLLRTRTAPSIYLSREQKNLALAGRARQQTGRPGGISVGTGRLCDPAEHAVLLHLHTLQY
jgi:hypothetical protein